jgi:FKBP-type peptidyl-prolyl cis-trans isomerase FkpA
MHGVSRITCKMGRVSLFLVFLLAIMLSACLNKPAEQRANGKPGKNDMADLNRYFVQKDRERIQNYIERKSLSMTESPTGLWYQVIKEGSGKTFTDNDRIVMEYDCSLLDGTVCYTSADLGQKELILGKSQMEPGMNEGLRLVSPGTEAIFIMPPFLAYGLIGDGKMIPSRAVIVYNVKILSTE